MRFKKIASVEKRHKERNKRKKYTNGQTDQGRKRRRRQNKEKKSTQAINDRWVMGKSLRCSCADSLQSCQEVIPGDISVQELRPKVGQSRKVDKDTLGIRFRVLFIVEAFVNTKLAMKVIIIIVAAIAVTVAVLVVIVSVAGSVSVRCHVVVRVAGITKCHARRGVASWFVEGW